MKSRPLREFLDAKSTVETMRRSIGSELKNAREAADIKQSAFAKQIGVHQAYLSMVEGGHRTPSSDLLRNAIRVLEGEEGDTSASQGTSAKGDAAKARERKESG